MELEIIYQDHEIVVINKPHGLLVHRTKIANDATEFAVQILRNQLGQKVFPVHRLDRKTSGILIFTLDHESNNRIQKQFRERTVNKEYIALVRGFIPKEGRIDYALSNEDGPFKESVTEYQCLERYELPIPFGEHSSSRYSLVRLLPMTGRFHQLRKHMAHIFHPIIGDRPHGCNKQNKLWKEQFNMTRMLLHADRLELEIREGERQCFYALKSDVFKEVLRRIKPYTIGAIDD